MSDSTSNNNRKWACQYCSQPSQWNLRQRYTWRYKITSGGVELLLVDDAEINAAAADVRGRIALQVAAESGHIDT